tara:strand:- start:52 stop:432 length:381 start_codon:yes stop_codon:yes gene_type:complete
MGEYMESISNKLSNMKSNFYYETNQSNASKFFKGSILHLSISLEIGVAHFNDKSISFEIICKNIPKRIGSRSSVQNILKEAVLLGFFLKKESSIDKRIKVYSFSQEYSEMIKDWLESFKILNIKSN